jgi:hypothetical protein
MSTKYRKQKMKARQGLNQSKAQTLSCRFAAGRSKHDKLYFAGTAGKVDIEAKRKTAAP